MHLVRGTREFLSGQLGHIHYEPVFLFVSDTEFGTSNQLADLSGLSSSYSLIMCHISG
jgi:hypothetical protein